jgi:type I restriction enzyme S subunit
MNKQTAQLLEDHFDTAFAAPDGIKKLRELILTLAMQGKLVEQDPNDPPASELLKEIEAEKERISHEGTKTRRNKEKNLPPIKPDEIPYELPQCWEWVRLGDLFTIVYGKGLPTSKLTTEGYDVFGANGIIGTYSEFLYESSQLLVSCRGAYSGKPNISPPQCFVTSNSLILENTWNFLDLRYFYYAIEIADKEKIVTGSAQPQVTTTNLEPFIVPLPPLPEQQRIVERIDQLMARCDALEKLRVEREEKRLAVHAAAIKQLLEPTCSPLRAFVPSCETSSPFAFLAQHFGELYTVKENVAELRKAILQLAVMGRLVPQDPNDPPAAELLQQIDAEKQRLIKEKKIKRSKPVPPVDIENVPYEVPETWKWVRLGEICSYIQRGKGPKYADVSSHRVISQKCVRWYGLDLEPARYIDPSSLNKYDPIRFLKAGDLLWNSTGTGTIGRACLFPQELEGKEIVADSHVTVVRSINTSQQFLWRWIQSPIVQREIEGSASGTTNQIELNTTTVINHLMPLPPVAEQERIVTKINQLMALCDTLDQQIDAATDKQTELLNAVMAQV